MTQISSYAAGEVYKGLVTNNNVKAIKALYESITSDLPEDIISTPLDENQKVPPGIDRSKCSYFSYDEGHSGRFSLFGSDGATIESAHVLDRENALEYIRHNLSFGDSPGQKECVVFFNGMRTFSQPNENQGWPSAKRVEYYSRMLLGMRLAHVHTATNLDQPPGRINVKNAKMLKLLAEILGRVGIKDIQPNSDGDIFVSPIIIDMLQAALSALSAMDSPIKETMRKMIFLASEETPLTLMVYSRGSSECNAALQECFAEVEDKDDFKAKLRKCVTVMTIGCSAKVWPDGPRYVHLSSWDDWLARFFCNANRNTFAGADAVFLHNNSPYGATVDAHNFQGGTVQFLSLLMLKNEVRSIADLWSLGQEEGNEGIWRRPKGILGTIEAIIGRLKTVVGIPPSPVGGGMIEIPDDVDELVHAMIAITGGTKYLWDREESLKIMKPLPEKTVALQLLSEKLGCEEELRGLAEYFDE